MKRSLTRAAIVGAAGVGVLLPAAATAAFAAKPVPGAAAGASTPVAKVLGEIADTPANRTQIAINNLAALWHSAGLPPEPSLLDVLPTKGKVLPTQAKGFDATGEILVGSPLGIGQLTNLVQDPAPFGYKVLSLSQEVVVGSLPNQLTEVWGPIQPGPVGAALRKFKAVKTQAGGAVLFNAQAAARQVTNEVQLQEIGRFALPGGGGRLVGAGAKVPESALTGLVDGKTQKNSLASDPAVSQLLAVFPSNATTLTMGTSFIQNPLRGRATPAARRQLLTTSGLGKVHAPTFGGLAFSGPPNAARVTAAAVYPNAADAKVAADAVGTNLRTGTSPVYNVRYTKLWQVTGTSTHGDVAVIQLATKTPARVVSAFESLAFPLFWKL